MIGVRHDAAACAACNDTGFIDDPLSAVEEGMPDLLPCPRNCGASEEASMLGGYDQWKCAPPVDERELDEERRAAVEEELGGIERTLARARAAGTLPYPLEEGDDIAW